jgi:pimeloyl-ACP methyl ester carboxylesterase
MRGRGLSDWDPEPEHYTPNTYVNDVLALLEFLGIPKAVFVGTSMGGIVVMALAVVAPQAIAACVLNDIGPIVAPEAIQRIKGYVGGTVSIANWSDAGEYAKLTNHVAFPEYSSEDWNRFARRLFREEAGIPKLDYDPRIADQLRNNRYSSPAEGAWREFGFLAQACPTLIIRGELSDVLSREIADRMKAAQPSVRLTEVPRVGHAPMLTEPAAAEAIADFLAQVP